MKYVIIHLILLAYFFVADVYTAQLMPSLAIAVQWIIGSLYLGGLLLFFLRLDLVCLDPTLNRYTHPDPLEKRVFFFKALQFYLLLIGAPIVMLSGVSVPSALKSYLVFLLIVNTLNGSRYAVPNYGYYVSRYQAESKS